MLPLFPLALLARAASLSVTLPCVVEARERRRGGEEPLGVGGLGGGRALVFNGARSGGMESGCGPPPHPACRRVGLVVVSSFGWLAFPIASERRKVLELPGRTPGSTWAWDSED